MPFRPDATLPGALVTEDHVQAPRLIIMGGPGCGKGTLCKKIVDKMGVAHISVGDILRQHVEDGTELGQQVREYLQVGRLIPDELAIEIVFDHLNKPEIQEKGWLLDNFPRTQDQVDAMMELQVIPERFIFIDLPESTLRERCTGRLFDPVTQNIYHERFYPPPDDPVLRARLMKREDDCNEEALTRRLDLYHENIEGVLDYLEDLKKEFDGELPPDELFRQIHEYIKPDAPLYARASELPELVSADAVRQHVTSRQDETDPVKEETSADLEGKGDDGEAGAGEPKTGAAWRRAMAMEIIEECMGEGFDRMQEEERVTRLTYQYAAQHAIGTLDMLINVHFIDHDKGDKAAEASWDGGEEPAPAAMDTWGRGAVPMKRKLKPLTAENMDTGQAPGGSRPASASSRGSRATAFRARSREGSGEEAKRPTPKKEPKREKKEEARVKSAEAEPTPADKLRGMLKTRQDDALAKARRAKEYQAEVEKMERQVKTMQNRGQNFTMDHKGELLLVNEIPGDKLQAPTVQVKTALGPAVMPPDDPPLLPADRDQPALPPPKVFTPSETVQPPAAESHVLASGVTLREGGVVKSGPVRERDSLHMTRREYSVLIETESIDPGISLRRQSGAADAPPSREEARAEGQDRPREPESGAEGAVEGAGGEAAVPGGGAKTPDMGGAGGRVSVQGGTGGMAGGVAVGGDSNYDWDSTEFYAKDMAIVTDPLARTKPDGRARKQSVGVRAKNPRDRFIYPDVSTSPRPRPRPIPHRHHRTLQPFNFPTQIVSPFAFVSRDPRCHAVQPDKFLPPPIFPGKHGHGVVTSYLANENQFVRDAAARDRSIDSSEGGRKTTLSPIRGASAKLDASDEGRKVVVDYTRDFPKGPTPHVTTVNPKLLRELKVDQQ